MTEQCNKMNVKHEIEADTYRPHGRQNMSENEHGSVLRVPHARWQLKKSYPQYPSRRRQHVFPL